MLSQRWATSPRQYGVAIERSCKIPMGDGINLNCDIFRPDSDGRFPVILSASPYSLELQSAPVRSKSFSSVGGATNPGDETANSLMEAGDPWFFARHGYVHIILNVRGSGKSEGQYGFTNKREVEDIAEAIEWAARQEWCSGAVGMFGVSYFAIIQHLVAGIAPKSLRCLFAPFGSGGFREIVFKGGVLNAKWLVNWAPTISMPTLRSFSLEEFGERVFTEKVAAALAEPDLAAVPQIREALSNPLVGANALITDIILHREDGPFWQERTPAYENITLPIYMGACWGTFGIHLPPLFPAWEKIKSQAKKMVVGPPLYLDRPVFQFQYESLRWFDHWLKGMETGLDEDPKVRLFMMGSNNWQGHDAWPPKETRWTPFFLHERGLLSEREHWWAESHDTYFDTPWQREGVEYWTPQLIDHVEITGPLALELYAASSHEEVRWVVSFFEQDAQGKRKLLTKGVLDGGYQGSAIDAPPYAPKYDFRKKEYLVPEKLYKFNVSLVPTANCFAPGTRFGIRISCVDDAPHNSLEGAAAGHLRSASARRIAIYHDETRPSCLWVPVLSGNVIGTFLGGGEGYVDFSQT